MTHRRQITLPQGTIEYQDIGSGPPLLFIHGLLVNGDLWNTLIPALSKTHRCIVPDLPLGGHRLPANAEADLTPAGFARIIIAFIEALDLRDIVLIGNDTGGAICQVTLTQAPHLFAALVLTNCDAFEEFPPSSLKIFQHVARLPGSMWMGGQMLRLRVVQRWAVWLLQTTPVTPTQADSYFHGLIHIGGVQRDARKAFLGVSNRYTLEAARKFDQFKKPVLLIWGQDDVFFKPVLAACLQRHFQDATLIPVANAKTFVMQDRPDAVLTALTQFLNQRLREHAVTP